MSEGYSFFSTEVDESDSNYTENEIKFRRNNLQELHNEYDEQQEAPIVLVDTEFAIKPGTLQVQFDEDVGNEDCYEPGYVDSEGNEYAILTTDNDEVIEAEYIDFENTELEEGEIRDENLYQALRTGYSLNEIPELLYECSVCQRTFSQKGNLLRHYQTHTGDRPFACKLCGHRFTQKSNLQKHVATHNGDKKFECGVCHKGFVQKANLIRHLRIHTGEKPFECTLCGHKFTQKGNLNKHMQLHTSNTVSVCDYCGCKFSSYTAKMRHETSVHSDRVPEYDDDEDINNNQCDECPASFRTKLALRKHKKFHK